MESDGPVKIRRGVARVAHLRMGIAMVMEWNGVARRRGDGQGEVRQCPTQSPNLARHAPRL